MDYKLFIDGAWVSGGESLEVRNKYTQEIIGILPMARQEEVEAAIAAAQRSAPLMAEMPAHRRSAILGRTAALILERKEDLARSIEYFEAARLTVRATDGTLAVHADGETVCEAGSEIALSMVPAALPVIVGAKG